MDIANLQVLHNQAEHRFEVHIDGRTAFLSYKQFPDRLVLVHTEVPPQDQGEGIAAKLVAAALDFARASHLTAVPVCPYVVNFLHKHPEYQDVLSPEDRQKIVTPAPHPDPESEHADTMRSLAFYEIARRANLTDHPDLVKSPAFQEAQALTESRADYFRKAFGKQEAVDDYIDLRLEGALAKQGKTWQDVWAEFAPDSLKKYPLPPGTVLKAASNS